MPILIGLGWRGRLMSNESRRSGAGRDADRKRRHNE